MSPATEPLVPPAPRRRTPAEMVVTPVYVLLPAKVTVPDPSLVTVPVPVAIGSATVMSPAPPMVRMVLLPLMPLPLTTSSVSVPAWLWIEPSDASVIAPETVLLPETLTNEPCPDPPLPLSVICSAIVLPPAMARVPPLLTTVPAVVAPRAVSLLATRVPALMVVTPM